MDCATYPTAVKQPVSTARLRSEGLICVTKGARAAAARVMRLAVTALAGSASFMSEPSAKLVP
eukprot:scaffold523278_cov47-Attheya_sp.AAC.1